MNSKKIQRQVLLAIMVAIGVVISPILRIEGMAPMQHLINVTVSVLLGPIYSLVCAIMISIIRMTFMSIPPLALTGSVFGAFLSGYLYRKFKKKIYMACLGEIIGTGIIGSMVSFPVMKYISGNEKVSLFFYTPFFIMGSTIGSLLALILLTKLKQMNILERYERKLW